MSLGIQEFEAILRDESKTIVGDIHWVGNDDHWPWVVFREEIESDTGWPLFLAASYNPLIPAVTFAVIKKDVGRIYALDIGKDHHNPQCNQVGEVHKHSWTERYRDKAAYVPPDITEPADRPVAVWHQFCAEARIKHQGRLHAPPPVQGNLFI